MVYLTSLLMFYQYLRLSARAPELIRPHSQLQTILWLTPVVLLWCFLIGGQYNVGTDYFSYIDVFSGEKVAYLLMKGDYGFVNFVSFCNSIGLFGQDILLLISLISVLILLYAGRIFVKDQELFLFLFVFIVFASAFHNQMNAVRQYSAVYLYTLGGLLLFKKQYIWAIIPLFAAATVHSSSIAVLLLLPIILIIGKFVRKRRYLFAFLLIAFLLSVAFPESLLNNILSRFDQYAYYADDGRLEVGGISIINKVTKYIYVPLIIYAIYLFPHMRLTEEQKQLFVIGLCGYCVKIALMDITIVQRMGAYFEIFMCIPMTYLLIHHLSYHRIRFPFLMVYLLLPYAAKVTLFAVNEYTYQSYFFR